jgi:hypothetical protein
MPKYFCEYCGIYLTHSSPGGRKQHSHGRKHINNKIEYYSQFLYEFQQNTYNNLIKMASELNNKDQQAQQQVQGFNSFQKFIIPTGPLKPGVPMSSSSLFTNI